MKEHTFNFLKEKVTLHWSNDSILQKFLLMQRKGGLESWQKTFDYFSSSSLKNIDRTKPMTIIDVGSGIGIFSLILSVYFPNSTLYLLDGDSDISNTKFKSNLIRSVDHPIYNSWVPLHDIIETSKLDSKRFKILNRYDQWPKSDLIFSFFSWGWHYPINTYLLNLCESIKKNTSAFLTVSNWPEQNIDMLNSFFSGNRTITEIKINKNCRFSFEYEIDMCGNIGYLKEYYGV